MSLVQRSKEKADTKKNVRHRFLLNPSKIAERARYIAESSNGPIATAFASGAEQGCFAKQYGEKVHTAFASILKLLYPNTWIISCKRLVRSIKNMSIHISRRLSRGTIQEIGPIKRTLEDILKNLGVFIINDASGFSQGNVLWWIFFVFLIFIVARLWFTN